MRLRFVKGSKDDGREKEYIRENGFIVISLTYLFELMEKISIFYFIRWIGKRIGDNADVFLRNGIFSEIWVLGNLVFAIIAQNVVKSTDVKWLSIVFMLYAIERIWEMFVYQTNVLFLPDLEIALWQRKMIIQTRMSLYKVKKVTRKIKVVTYIRLYLQRER